MPHYIEQFNSESESYYWTENVLPTIYSNALPVQFGKYKDGPYKSKFFVKYTLQY